MSSINVAGRADAYDQSNIFGIADRFAKQLEAFRGRDENARIAVAHDVTDLVRLQQRIERDEDPSGGCGAKTRSDGLDSLFEKYGNPLPSAQPGLDQRGRKRPDLAFQ